MLCSRTSSCRWNDLAADGVKRQLLRSGMHPGDSGCRRTSCTDSRHFVGWGDWERSLRCRQRVGIEGSSRIGMFLWLGWWGFHWSPNRFSGRSTRSPRCSYSLCILQLTATWSYFVALGRLAQKVKSAAAMILQPRELLSKKWNGLDFGQVYPVVRSSWKARKPGRGCVRLSWINAKKHILLLKTHPVSLTLPMFVRIGILNDIWAKAWRSSEVGRNRRCHQSLFSPSRIAPTSACISVSLLCSKSTIAWIVLGIDYVVLISHRWEYLISSRRIWMLCTIWWKREKYVTWEQAPCTPEILEIMIRGGKPRIGSLVLMRSHMDLIYSLCQDGNITIAPYRSSAWTSKSDKGLS